MDIVVQAPVMMRGFVTICHGQLRRYTKQGMVAQELKFQKEDGRWICHLEDHEIFCGLNAKSALWCRSKTKYQETAFYLDLKIRNMAPVRTTVLLTVKPHHGEGDTLKIYV